MMAAVGWMLLKISFKKIIARLNRIVVAAAKAAPGTKIIIQTKKNTIMARRNYYSYSSSDKFFNVFESPKSLSEFIKKTPQTATGKKYGTVQTESNKDFHGTESWKEAEELLVSGDFENMKKINTAAIKNDITGGGYERKNTYKHSPVGFLPVVPKVLSGCPDNMLSMRKQMTASTKILNICYNSTTACNVKADDMIKTAANVASVIRGLEKSGYRVNLFVAGICRNKSQTIGAAVKIKDAGEYLDTLRLAYPIVHPSFFRRHILAYMERCKGYRLQKNYGYVLETSYSKLAVKAMFPGKDMLYLDFETCKGKTSKEITDILTSGK